MLQKIIKRWFTKYAGNVITPAIYNLGIRKAKKNIFRNLSYAELIEQNINEIPSNPDTLPSFMASNGAISAYSGIRTGRSPNDKRVVEDEITKNEIWYGKYQKPIKREVYNLIK